MKDRAKECQVWVRPGALRTCSAPLNRRPIKSCLILVAIFGSKDVLTVEDRGIVGISTPLGGFYGCRGDSGRVLHPEMLLTAKILPVRKGNPTEVEILDPLGSEQLQ